MNYIKILALFIMGTRLMGMDLIDDKKYTDIAKNAELEAAGNPLMLLDVAGKYMEARDYKKASDIYTEIIKNFAVTHPMIYSNQAVFLGKQKRYEEAIEMADRAIKMDPTAIHPKMVKASWLWESGKHDDATALYNSVQVPASGSPDESLYYGCKACYFASVGDEKEMQSAINQCMELKDKHFVTFIRRDIVFDPYRKKEWFIQLFGNTVKE
jgi:tetratricopeptide (TPR) repeat protein